MLDWSRLTAHSLLWDLGFHSERIGLRRVATAIYHSLCLLPGNSAVALRYRAFAVTKLVQLQAVDAGFLRKNPFFSIAQRISMSEGESAHQNKNSSLMFESPNVMSGVWSIAGLAEFTNERDLAKNLYLAFSRMCPVTVDEYLYVSLSLFKIGQVKASLDALESALTAYPASESLLANRHAIGLATGSLSAFLGNSKVEQCFSHDLEQSLNLGAAFIANGGLPEFALRLPRFLSEDPALALALVGRVSVVLSKKVFPFLFVRDVLGTMTLSGVRIDLVSTFRKSMKFRSVSKKQRQMRNRILDISTKANFSYDINLFSNLAETWSRIDQLALERIKLVEPLSELPSWSPWVGAFSQSPSTPIWKTVERLLPLVRHTWPQVEFVASHVTKRIEVGKKIKIGFLYNPSMPMLSGFLPYFSSGGFETYFIYPKGGSDSKELAKWKSHADQTIEISERNLADSISKVSNLSLDFLLSGPSTPALWFLSLTRVAKIQAILLEPAWTDGSPNLDYYISWRDAEPLRYEDTYRSSVALLNNPPYWIDSAVSHLIQSDSLRNKTLSKFVDWQPGERIYLCASTPLKLHPEMDEAMLSILEEDSHARIVFFRGETLGADALKARLHKSLGDFFSRVTFLNTLASDDAHAMLQSAHCVFDSFPLNGMSSSFDGLKLGVPIVTIESEVNYGKWTSSIYRFINVSGLSASTKSEFVEKCLVLASDAKLRQSLSDEIVSRFHKLVSSQEAALELIEFVKEAWVRYGKNQKPADWLDSRWRTRE